VFELFRRSRHGLARGERDSGRARRGAGVVAGGAGAGRQGVRTQPDHHHEQEPPRIFDNESTINVHNQVAMMQVVVLSLVVAR
jgi:hypothetical protein